MQSMVTRIPNQTSGERYLTNSPHPDVYRQALRIILETPEIEGHLNYITAGTIVTILGSWLTSSMIKSRAFTMFTDILLFFGSTALAGLLIGIMLGEGLLPKEIVPVLLFVVVGISILVPAIFLGGLMFQPTQRSSL